MKPARLRGNSPPRKIQPPVRRCRRMLSVTGFTGTSCWIDPHRERVFILLTNRTHDHPLPFTNINATRREFHTLAVSALDNL